MLQKTKIHMYFLLLVSSLQVNHLYGEAACVVNPSTMSVQELQETLILAVKNNDIENVQKLIDFKVDPNLTFEYAQYVYDDYDRIDTYSILEYAVTCDYKEIVSILLKAKIKPESLRESFILAARKGHAEIVENILRVHPNVRTTTSTQALLQASAAFPNTQERGCTGTKDCKALNNYIDTIKLLIQFQANVNAQDESGNTPLILITKERLYTEAQHAQRKKIIETFIKAGAHINSVNKDNQTALMIAVKNINFYVVEQLLEHLTIKVNLANNNGDTALMIAIKNIKNSYIVGNAEQYNQCIDSQKIVDLFCKFPGVDFHHVNKQGQTAKSLLEKYCKDNYLPSPF